MPEQDLEPNGMNGGYVIAYAVAAIVLFAMGFLVGVIL